MAETKTTDTFDGSATGLTQSEASLVSTIADELETDVTTLDVYQGELTGALYAEVGTEYQRATITETGMQVTQVATPDETITPLARIEPDEGETVDDAVDSLTFAGD